MNTLETTLALVEIVRNKALAQRSTRNENYKIEINNLNVAIWNTVAALEQLDDAIARRAYEKNLLK